MRRKERNIRRGLRYWVLMRHMQSTEVAEYRIRNMTEGAMSWETVGRPPARLLRLLLLDEDIFLVIRLKKRKYCGEEGRIGVMKGI